MARSVKIHLQSGQQFGNWTVLYEAPDSSGKHPKYWCRCACGTERSVYSQSLRLGKSLGCKKHVTQEREVTIGRKFHRLTVIGASDNMHKTRKNPYGAPAVLCRCNCGSETKVPKQALLSGRIKSCGCLRTEVVRLPKPHLVTHGLSTNKALREHGHKFKLIWDKFKLTEYMYNQMLVQQNNVCAICKKSTNQLFIDHDHSCCPEKRTCGNCVRGLLCSKCNYALGKFQDSVERMRQACTYLKNGGFTSNHQ